MKPRTAGFRYSISKAGLAATKAIAPIKLKTRNRALRDLAVGLSAAKSAKDNTTESKE